MAYALTEKRVDSFLHSSGYLQQSNLRETLTCRLFVGLDRYVSDRKKRALRLDQYVIDRTPRSLGPGAVWLVGPELSGAEETALGMAKELSSRGWKVHLVTRVKPGPPARERCPGLHVHHVLPLTSYAGGITGRGPVVSFSLPLSAGLALHGHRSICMLDPARDEVDLISLGDAAFIPDFLMGDAAAVERKVHPMDVDVLERLLMAKTPNLPPGPRLPTVSACIIARDEEGMIEGCLESLTSLADETVVNDTGSQDGTAEIAEAYGATVVKTRWQDDFSGARNRTLSLAKCSHILTIDADERLVTETVLEAGADLIGDNEAWDIQIRDDLDNRIRTSYVIRLFRNRLHHRYSGRIHEQIGPSVRGSVGVSRLALNHLGYRASVSTVRGKRLRNIGLLVQDIDAGATLERSYLRYQGGLEMMLSGRYRDGTEVLSEVLDEAALESAFRPNVGLHLCEGFLAVGQLTEAYAVAKRLLQEYPGFVEIAEMVAQALIEHNLLNEAESLLSAVTGVQGRADLPTSQGAGTFRLQTLWTMLLLGRGLNEEALPHLREALKADSGFGPAQSLLVANWPREAEGILRDAGAESVRPAVLTLISTGEKGAALSLARSMKDLGSEGEVHLATGEYGLAAQTLAMSDDPWDNRRAEVIASCGVAGTPRPDHDRSESLVARVLAGQPCEVLELADTVKILVLLLSIGASAEFKQALGSLDHFEDRGRFLVARALAEAGFRQEACDCLAGTEESAEYLPLKADLAYHLGKYQDAACYYGTLDFLRPLSPVEYVRHIDSLVNCGQVGLAREATLKALGLYRGNYAIARIAKILGLRE